MNKLIIFVIVLSSISFINQQISEFNRKITKNIYKTFSDVKSINQEATFTSQKIPKHIYENMLGKSIPLEYKDDVDITSLCYLQVSYFDFNNKSNIGELIVNSKIANDVLDIFKELYEIKYPLEKIKLIDEYSGNDTLSMSDNNTCSFCYRVVSGTSKLSKHSNGTAIDVNPLYNPYVANNYVSPVSGMLYANRSINNKHQINRNDALYKIFINHGWSWGGNWHNKKDYQHFEKQIN